MNRNLPAARALLHPRDEIIRTMERIDRSRMTTTSGRNLSIRDQNGDLWITPARGDQGTLRREDIGCVRADGRREGLHPPSSELPFHQAIDERRPELGGSGHAQAVATACSVTGAPPDSRTIPESHRFLKNVARVPSGEQYGDGAAVAERVSPVNHQP